MGSFNGNPACSVHSITAEETHTHTHLHDLGVGAGGGTLRLADEVGLRVGAAQTLLTGSQAAVAVRGGEAHAVALLPREVPRRGGGEDDQLASASAHTAAAAVLQTRCIVQACGQKARGTRLARH